VWWEFAQRNPQLARPTICLCDGQEALGRNRRSALA
jgi:hypothetical protein